MLEIHYINTSYILDNLCKCLTVIDSNDLQNRTQQLENKFMHKSAILRINLNSETTF